jgi:hypothetical protein
VGIGASSGAEEGLASGIGGAQRVLDIVRVIALNRSPVIAVDRVKSRIVFRWFRGGRSGRENTVDHLVLVVQMMAMKMLN